MNNTKDIKQSGFVSVIVAAMIMIILSLITIGFTRIMQREQQQVLDRQLSKQALYAAESGINDVYGALKANPNLPAQKTTCDVVGNVGGQANPAKNGGKLDEDGTVAYTCVLYDKTPTELAYSLNTSESNLVELITESGNPFSTMRFRWGNEMGNNDIEALPECGFSTTFPSTRPGNTPLLRVDLTDTTTLSRDALIISTDYLYLAPCKGPGTNQYTYLSEARGVVVGVACNSEGTLPCEILIDGLSSKSYLARIRAIYDSAQLVIGASETISPGVTDVVEFRKAQTSIDVTAKANDVVRRLRVTIPFAETDSPPEGVFQAFDGVCKLMSVDFSVPATPIITDPCT